MKYTEFRDISSRKELPEASTEHLGYDLNIEGNALKANQTTLLLKRVLWTFYTKSPILAVFQLIHGIRLVKLKVSREEKINKLKKGNYAKDRFALAEYHHNKKNENKTAESCPIIYVQEKTPISLFWKTIIILSILFSIILIVVLTRGKKRVDKIEQKKITEEIGIDAREETKSTILLDGKNSEKSKGTEDNKATGEIQKKKKKVKSTPQSSVTIGRLTIYNNLILGYGSLGTIVYEGKFENRTVAVKRLLRPFHEVAVKEITALIISDSHPNVIRYFTKEEDS